MRYYNWEKSVIKCLEMAKNREIVIVGNDSFTVEIAYTVQHLKYPLSIIVTDNPKKFSAFKDDVKILGKEWLEKENLDAYFVFGALMTGHKEVYTVLVERGRILRKDFTIIGIGGYTKPLDSIDSLLTLNRRNEDIVGFRVFDNCKETGKKIVILGNSTSDPSTGNIKSWSEWLFEKLCNMGTNITIYNGAITGYSSTQEFLELNRDVLQLKPDMVISFSGYNDVQGNSTEEGFPFLHKYEKKCYDFWSSQERLAPDSMAVRNVSSVTHGIKNELPDYEIWINNMTKMYVICKAFHIKFIGYLQPMVDYKVARRTNEHQKVIEEFLKVAHSEQLPDKVNSFCEEAVARISQYPYIHDLTNIFCEEYNVFYDTCHYTEYGNQIIAENILKDIEREG